MKDKRANRGGWLRRLGNWWSLLKGDAEQLVWREAPSASAWRAMIEIVEAFEDVIEAEEEGTLSPEHPQAGIGESLMRLREYLDDVSNGPLLETGLGRRLRDLLDAHRYGFAKPQLEKEVA